FCHLYDRTEIHHGHAFADVLDDGQVVGNENISQPELQLQIFQQIDYLRLNGDVERRYRFVTNDQLGRNRQGASNSDALALTAGELMWVTPHVIGMEPHCFKELDNAVHELPMRVYEAMNDQGLAYDRADRHARIE